MRFYYEEGELEDGDTSVLRFHITGRIDSDGDETAYGLSFLPTSTSSTTARSSSLQFIGYDPSILDDPVDTVDDTWTSELIVAKVGSEVDITRSVGEGLFGSSVDRVMIFGNELKYTVEEGSFSRGDEVMVTGTLTESGITSISLYRNVTSTQTSLLLRLTIVCIEDSTLSLTFDANGGLNAPGDQTVAVRLCGNEVVGGGEVQITDDAPRRNSWQFAGWAASETAEEAEFQPGDTIHLSEDTVLYAIWERTLTLSYYVNGGSGAPSSQSVTVHSTPYTFTISDTVPVRLGYTFLGWATASNATSASYQPGDEITLSSSRTLSAVWSHTINLYFNANQGSGAPTSMSWTGVGSHVFTIPDIVPVRDGYEFLGWSMSNVAETPSYQPGGTISLSQSGNLYAVWELITHTITFVTNGGSYVEPLMVAAGGIAEPPDDPTMQYFVFKGWYKSVDYTTEWKFSDFLVMPAP